MILPFVLFIWVFVSSQQISVGNSFNCYINPNNFLSCSGVYSFAVPSSIQFSTIACGTDFCCGIKSTDSTLNCFGDTSSELNVYVSTILTDSSSILLGVPVSNVATSVGNVCVIKSADKSVVCLGNNDYQQKSVIVDQYRQISVGQSHACGVNVNNVVRCWGSNSLGRSSPPSNTLFSLVSCGTAHSCGIKLNDLMVVCWGPDVFGILNSPPDSFSYISSGKNFACGLTSIGQQVKCWGYDALSQVSNRPVSMSIKYNFVQISLLEQSACTITSDNSIFCWGDSSGAATYARQNIKYIVSSGLSSCSITSSNSIKCWGSVPYYSVSNNFFQMA